MPEVAALYVTCWSLAELGLTSLDGMSQLPVPKQKGGPPTCIDLSGNPLVNLQGLPTFPELEILDVRETHLTTFLGASLQPRLRDVFVSGAPIASHPKVELMTVLAFGPAVERLDGKTISVSVRNEAERLGPHASMCVCLGLTSLQEKRSEYYRELLPVLKAEVLQQHASASRHKASQPLQSYALVMSRMGQDPTAPSASMLTQRRHPLQQLATQQQAHKIPTARSCGAPYALAAYLENAKASASVHVEGGSLSSAVGKVNSANKTNSFGDSGCDKSTSQPLSRTPPVEHAADALRLSVDDLRLLSMHLVVENISMQWSLKYAAGDDADRGSAPLFEDTTVAVDFTSRTLTVHRTPTGIVQCSSPLGNRSAIDAAVNRVPLCVVSSRDVEDVKLVEVDSAWRVEVLLSRRFQRRPDEHFDEICFRPWRPTFRQRGLSDADAQRSAASSLFRILVAWCGGASELQQLYRVS